MLAPDAIVRSRQPAKPYDPQGNGAVVGSRLETIAGLTRAEYSQHPHITGGLIAAGVGVHLIEHPVAAITGQFAHCDVLADRPKARMLAQALNAAPDCRQSASCAGT
jgi:hypothetical protein